MSMHFAEMASAFDMSRRSLIACSSSRVARSEHVGEILHVGGHLGQLVERDALGGGLDEVHDVVHLAR